MTQYGNYVGTVADPEPIFLICIDPLRFRIESILADPHQDFFVTLKVKKNRFLLSFLSSFFRSVLWRGTGTVPTGTYCTYYYGTFIYINVTVAQKDKKKFS